MKLYLRLLSGLRPYRRHIFAALFCSVMVALATAAYAWLIRPILDDVFIRKDHFMLIVLPLLVFVIGFLKGIFSYGQVYLIRYVGHKLISDIRADLYKHLLLLPVGFHAKHHTGRLISHVINDVGLLQTAVSTVAKDVIQQSLTLVALTGVIFYQNFYLASLATFIIPFTVYPLVRLGRRLRRIAREGQEKVGDLTGLMQESFSGIRIIKAFGKEDFESERFSEKNRNYFKNVMKVTAVSESSSPVMETVGGIGAALIIWYGGYQVVAGTMTPGAFFSFMAASMMMYPPLRGLGSAHNVLQQALAAAERVYATLDEKNEREIDVGYRTLNSIKGAVEFRDVSFRYDGTKRAALSSVSLKANPGDMVAIVGSSGAGKSTLVNLIPRFYEPEDGTILIDGIPIQDITLPSLRRHIGIVSQEVVLFDHTIRWNIAYGLKGISDQQIMDAAEAAYAHLFISKMPEGYDSVIEKGGENFSGGERQRLAIARALLKDPPILIFDEATSALDAESEFMVRKAMMNLVRHRTTFVIAHRFSTIQKATFIVVLDKGQVVEVGRHEELIRRDGVYKRIYQMQFKDAEVKIEGQKEV